MTALMADLWIPGCEPAAQPSCWCPGTLKHAVITVASSLPVHVQIQPLDHWPC